jgi:hypothetical protein
MNIPPFNTMPTLVKTQAVKTQAVKTQAVKTQAVKTQRVKTPAEEVWFLVQQWYFSRGKLVPADEEKVCKEEIAKEAVQISYNTAGIRLTRLKDALSEATDFQKKAELMREIAQCQAILAANPELNPPETKATYGSDSFWKDYWAKKRAAGWVSKKDAASAAKAASSRK